MFSFVVQEIVAPLVAIEEAVMVEITGGVVSEGWGLGVTTVLDTVTVTDDDVLVFPAASLAVAVRV